AGGSLQTGNASAVVLEFSPASGRVVRVGLLPAPTTHAAAAAIGSTAYVLGGRGPARDTPTSRIVAITANGRIRPAGRLRLPQSDPSALSPPGRIVVLGGRGRTGTVSTIVRLRAVAVSIPKAS